MQAPLPLSLPALPQVAAVQEEEALRLDDGDDDDDDDDDERDNERYATRHNDMAHSDAVAVETEVDSIVASTTTTTTTTTTRSPLGRLCECMCPCNPSFFRNAFLFVLLANMKSFFNALYVSAFRQTMQAFDNFSTPLYLDTWFYDLVTVMVGLIGVFVWNKCCRSPTTVSPSLPIISRTHSFFPLYGPPAISLVVSYLLESFFGNLRQLQIIQTSALLCLMLMGKIIVDPTTTNSNTHSWMRWAQVVSFSILTMCLQVIVTAPKSGSSSSSWTTLGVICLLLDQLCFSFRYQWYSYIWNFPGQEVSVWHVMVGVYAIKLPCTTIILLWQGELGRLASVLFLRHETDLVVLGRFLLVAFWQALGILAVFWIVRHLGVISLGYLLLILSVRDAVRNSYPDIPMNFIFALLPVWYGILLWVVVWEFVDQCRQRRRQVQRQLIPNDDPMSRPDFQDSDIDCLDERAGSTEMTCVPDRKEGEFLDQPSTVV